MRAALLLLLIPSSAAALAPHGVAVSRSRALPEPAALFVDEVAGLTLADGSPDDHFGAAVAIDGIGSRVIVGVPDDQRGTTAGTAWVFRREADGAWTREAMLAGGAPSAGDRFGASVAIDAAGDVALVGAPGDDTAAGVDSGSLWIFRRTGTSWALETQLAPTVLAGDGLGRAVALSSDGDVALAGAPGRDALGADSGGAYVFRRSGTWSLDGTLTLTGGAAGDGFGQSVALSGDATRALIGTPGDDNAGGTNAGSATVFVRGAGWSAEATITAADTFPAGDAFGQSVALSRDGGRALIGAHLDDMGATNTGRGYVYDRVGSAWSHAGGTLRGFTAGDYFGFSGDMSDDGARLVAGVPNGIGEASGLSTEVGYAHLITFGATGWVTDARAYGSVRALFDRTGESVAISGDGRWLVAGNPSGDTGRGLNAGHVWIFSVDALRPNGAVCGRAGHCASDFCIDGVCCGTACGGGVPDDCIACSAALTGGASGACAPLTSEAAASVVCRPPAGPCDVADYCAGGDPACPVDARAPTTRVCRVAIGTCDVADTCDGVSEECPTDQVFAAATICRVAAGPCDTEERCDGASGACPADGYVPFGVVCRAVAGPCDVEDRCDGASAFCPADDTLAAGSICRPSVGPCDVLESCDGVSPRCPLDGFLPADTVCNGITTGPCDAPDTCTGSTADCPVRFLADVECRASAGACDVAERCLGDSANCPSDRVQAADMVCRAASDPACDVEERCDGVAASCPSDVTRCAAPADAGVGDAGGAGDGGGVAAATGCTCRAGGRSSGLGGIGIAALALGLLLLRRTRVAPARALLAITVLAIVVSEPVGVLPRSPRDVDAVALAASRAHPAWVRRLASERASAAERPEHQPRVVDGSIALAGARYDDGMLRLTVRAGEVGLALASLGRGVSTRSTASGTEARVVGPEVSIERAPGVREWWRSLPSGLEHGVTIAARPTGEGLLVLGMRPAAGVHAEPREGDRVALLARNRVLAHYGSLHVEDARGVRLAARLLAVAGEVRIEVDDTGARYPLVVDPLLQAVAEQSIEGLTHAVLSADGSRAVLSDGGRGLVYVRSAGVWTQEAILATSPPASYDAYVSALAMSRDGTMAVLGVSLTGPTPVPGLARVFVRSGGSWTEQAVLTASDQAVGDGFGDRTAVSGDGSTIIVSAPGEGTPVPGAGSVYVFRRTAGAWSESAILRRAGASSGDRLGESIALSGDGRRVLAGSGRPNSNRGRVVVFEESGGWSEVEILAPSGVGTNDRFGAALALSFDGNRAVVATPSDDTSEGIDAGSLRVFARGGGVWTETQVLSASGRFLGGSVSLSDDATRVFASSSQFVWLFHSPTGSADGYTNGPPIFEVSDEERTQYGALSPDGARAVVGVTGEEGVPNRHTFFSIVASSPTGAACDIDGACLTGFCVDGVCCESDCGAALDDDCQACSGALTGAPNGVCAPLAPSVAPSIVCRAATDVCDTAERCVGTSTVCPADGAEPAGTACRAAVTPCDGVEVCDGTSHACPDDAASVAGTVCRPAAGDCDVPEACDGVSFACPGDAFAAPGAVCRSAASVCDVDEVCGGGPACPADVVGAAGVPCRDAVGPCDLAELCDGVGGSCPADAFVAAGTECDATIAGVCDRPDVCTGSTAECPATFLEGVVCRDSEGACDTPESCLGESADCPVDVLESADMVCRGSTDPSCDPAERCDGVSNVCPADLTSCVDRDGGANDGGVSDGGAPVAATGCACRAGNHEGRPPLVVALASILACLARRRRSSAPGEPTRRGS